MDLTQPLVSVLINERSWMLEQVISVRFKIPFYLCKFAFIEEFTRLCVDLHSIVKFFAFFRRCEIQQEFANSLVNWMFFEHINDRNSIAGFFDENRAEVIE